jgi:hypothetical protein
MVGTCSVHWDVGSTCKILIIKLKGKDHLGNVFMDRRIF